MIALTAAALAAGAGGCSFLFSEGPPRDHDTRAFFDCSEGMAPPILDSVATGLGILDVFGTATASPRPDNAGTAVAVQASLAVLAAGSAIYG